MFFVSALVLWIIIKLRFPQGKSIAKIIEERYGRPTLTLFRTAESTDFKYRRTLCDIEFLQTCSENRLTPKFLNFKLYRNDIRSTAQYKRFQNNVLMNELKDKENKLKQLKRKRNELFTQLKSTCSWIDFNHILNFLNNVNDRKIKSVKSTHDRKLFNLGLHHEVVRLNPNNLVFNYSKKILSDEEIDILSHGLKFALPPKRIKYARWFLPFEKLFNKLTECKIYDSTNDGYNVIRSSLKYIAFKTYYCFKPHLSLINKKYYDILENLKKDSNIVILKPDKGNGIVILDKIDYNEKMHSILNDTSKFKVFSEDWIKEVIKQEDKINRLLTKMKNSNEITKEEYEHLFASGTQPGLLYGLPKIHKTSTPLRPILSAIGTSGYKLAKFILPLLSSFATNLHTVKDSFSFVEEITSIKNSNQYYMASFDIKSLFTNIPLEETIQIATDKYFDQQEIPRMFTKNWFEQFLQLAVKNILFIFSGKLYSQVDGVGMGTPLGPTFANIFLCHHESNWLNNCPQEFKPKLYKRYVDDIFVLFSDASHVTPFLNYLNLQHDRIKFTSEIEKDNKLHFLDTTITRTNNVFQSSVFRKLTSTGLGLRFDSFVPTSYKINLISCLIHRAYKISSNYFLFTEEIDKLWKYFSGNKYPQQIFQQVLTKYLNDKFQPKPNIITVPKFDVYIKLQYLGSHSYHCKKHLIELINRYFPQVNLKIIFTNNCTIGSFFRFKDKIPRLLTSGIIYKYTCGQCQSIYIGETQKQLAFRISQHRGISFRTSQPLGTVTHSKIRDHSINSDHPIKEDNFKIIDSATLSDLRILESIYIHKHMPNLNSQGSSHQLFILK